MGNIVQDLPWNWKKTDSQRSFKTGVDLPPVKFGKFVGNFNMMKPMTANRRRHTIMVNRETKHSSLIPYTSIQEIKPSIIGTVDEKRFLINKKGKLFHNALIQH